MTNATPNKLVSLKMLRDLTLAGAKRLTLEQGQWSPYILTLSYGEIVVVEMPGNSSANQRKIREIKKAYEDELKLVEPCT